MPTRTMRAVSGIASPLSPSGALFPLNQVCPKNVYKIRQIGSTPSFTRIAFVLLSASTLADHSERSAVSGSTCVARHTGI
jgi:hypothetical protein